MRFVFQGLSFALFTAVSATAVPLPTCGTLIPARDTGTLVADLTCNDPNTPAVRLANGATLELGGFTLTGVSVDGGNGRTVVRCDKRSCTIVGPGDIAGNGTSTAGVCVAGQSPGGKLTMTSYGVSEIGVSNCYWGVLADQAKLRGVRAGGTVVGIQGTRLRLQTIDASGNSFASVLGHRVAGTDLDAIGNGSYGILGQGVPNSVRLKDLLATGNGDAGVLASVVSIRSGDVTGNNGYGVGIDVAAAARLRAVDLNCGKSGKVNGE